MAGVTNKSEYSPYEQDKTLSEYDDSRKRKLPGFDMPFFILTILILTIGVIMVLSASFARAYSEGRTPTYYFVRQTLFAVLGIAVMLIASLFPTNVYRRLSGFALVCSIGLLVLVLIIGEKGGGARRWIDLGFTTFQPSELAKISVILAFAAMSCHYKDKKMRTFRCGVLPFAAILGLIGFLLYKEPHLSGAIIIIGVGAIMMFLGGTRFIWFILGIVGVSLLGWILVGGLGYAQDRITMWLNPFSDPTDKGLQIIQSLYAVGSGGLLGLGLGQGRQKYLYLPEEHNDFIFSIWCEELGFIGAILILILFALLILRGFYIALNAGTKYGALVAAGISSLLAIQVFLNVAVVTNFIPCTGISLPFFSYGGTALVVQLGEMGIVLSVSREIPLKKRKKKKQTENTHDNRELRK